MFSSRPAQHLLPRRTAIQDAAFGVIDRVVGVDVHVGFHLFRVVNTLLIVEIVCDFLQGGG